MIDWIARAFDAIHQWLFEQWLAPLLFNWDMAIYTEDAFVGLQWLLAGVLQLLVMILILLPLERWRALEEIKDKAAVRVDMLYTLISRLGIFRLGLYFLVDPLWDELWSAWVVADWPKWQLDQNVAQLIGLQTFPAWGSFLLYLLVFDLVDYLIHRAQHQCRPWWALHATHHSQRQMTVFSDSRNHLLDDLLRDVIIANLGQLIGVGPEQFLAVVLAAQLVENLSHINSKLPFGWLGERLVVSPRFHRLHHAMELGHEAQGKGTLGGCNFAVLFPCWDILFGTASFDDRYHPTGIRDQRSEEGAVDYGHGYWDQQRKGLQRLWACVGPAAFQTKNKS
ncbi:MAG: sterol desaturase family protein [Ideonella sp.]|nr:sterol desaturase family protein [Ideonella sp.]